MSLLLLVGCNREPLKPEPAVAPVVRQAPPQKPPPKRVSSLRPLPPVVILVSESIPAYQQVAAQLQRLLPGRTTVFYPSDESPASVQQRAALRRPEYQQFVAIGLGAAREARALAGGEDELIFCQVLNYQEYDLIGPRAKGVGALPGVGAMFATWGEMSPAVKEVGVITGSGLESVVEAASREAATHGITLRHRVVSNDKELLFGYKQMAASVQGLWLLPDNRVLSGRIIKEVMAFSVRNSKQVAVFSDDLLALGGLLSITSRNEEIAAKVVQRLQEAYRGKGVPGPDLLLLEEGDIKINAIVAKRYTSNN